VSQPIDIVIPTFDNRGYLEACLMSLFANPTIEDQFRVIVVNNGEPRSCDWIASTSVTVVQPGRNLGWEAGLKLALAMSTAPFVCFLNDDTYFPPASDAWLSMLLRHFRDPAVGATGPSSNAVMGPQSIFSFASHRWLKVAYLIGFCVILRRSALDEVGGVDDTLPGGDDLDLSIRLRDAGYTLVADREVFVYHHWARTGVRVHGAANEGGWNSDEMVTATNHALIAKHGFRAWQATLYAPNLGEYTPPVSDKGQGADSTRAET